MLTPEDSKRVADALIREIQNVSTQLQNSAKYTLPDKVKQGIVTAIQQTLGYSQLSGVQDFQRLLRDIAADVKAALKR